METPGFIKDQEKPLSQQAFRINDIYSPRNLKGLMGKLTFAPLIAQKPTEIKDTLYVQTKHLALYLRPEVSEFTA